MKLTFVSKEKRKTEFSQITLVFSVFGLHLSFASFCQFLFAEQAEKQGHFISWVAVCVICWTDVNWSVILYNRSYVWLGLLFACSV